MRTWWHWPSIFVVCVAAVRETYRETAFFSQLTESPIDGTGTVYFRLSHELSVVQEAESQDTNDAGSSAAAPNIPGLDLGLRFFPPDLYRAITKSPGLHWARATLTHGTWRDPNVVYDLRTTHGSLQMVAQEALETYDATQRQVQLVAAALSTLLSASMEGLLNQHMFGDPSLWVRSDGSENLCTSHLKAVHRLLPFQGKKSLLRLFEAQPEWYARLPYRSLDVHVRRSTPIEWQFTVSVSGVSMASGVNLAEMVYGRGENMAELATSIMEVIIQPATSIDEVNLFSAQIGTFALRIETGHQTGAVRNLLKFGAVARGLSATLTKSQVSLPLLEMGTRMSRVSGYPSTVLFRFQILLKNKSNTESIIVAIHQPIPPTFQLQLSGSQVQSTTDQIKTTVDLLAVFKEYKMDMVQAKEPDDGRLALVVRSFELPPKTVVIWDLFIQNAILNMTLLKPAVLSGHAFPAPLVAWSIVSQSSAQFNEEPTTKLKFLELQDSGRGERTQQDKSITSVEPIWTLLQGEPVTVLLIPPDWTMSFNVLAISTMSVMMVVVPLMKFAAGHSTMGRRGSILNRLIRFVISSILKRQGSI